MTLDTNEDPDNIYIPDEEEQREINEILNREEEERNQPKVKNRIYHFFKTEEHFAGWLRVNGIAW